MKQSLSFLLTLICTFSFAQTSEKDWKKHLSKIEKSLTGTKVEISFDTLFHNGAPYCIYDEGEKMLGNVLDFTIKDLQGNEVIWGKMVTGQEINRPEVVTAYDLTFIQSSNKALFVNVIGNSLARDLVKYKLFQNGQYDAASEKKFVNFHPHQVGLSTQLGGQGNQGAGQYSMVQRNRNAMIQILGKEIKQDFKLIGYVNESRQSMGGEMVISVTITLPDGTLVANAQNEEVFGHDWNIVTAKDNKNHRLTSSLGKDKNDIVESLIRLLYL